MTTIRIVAAVVDTRNLTLYKEDGSTILIPQGDSRLRRILDEATPQLIAQKWADIQLTAAQDNSYVQFEEQSNGAVKFFRIAKEKLRQLLALGLVEQEPFDTSVATDAPVTPTTVGNVPGPATLHISTAGIYDVSEGDEVLAAMEQVSTRTMNVVDEIIAHAVPASSPEFDETSVAEQAPIEVNGLTPKEHTSDAALETIVAVIDGKAIPGVEKIKNQFIRANKLGSTTGVENFLKRVGSIIEKRSHSIEDLLKFMERGDMPIAEDGSIVIYKVLKTSRNTDKFVDCHTSNVEQWIGAYVCMDEALVDHNRNNECSNGLHVARRGYISSFAGDVCVMAKLAPEDVIAVPSYDANKMRVCGYHIVKELTNEQYGLVKRNKAITETIDGKKLLADVLAGNHTHRTHEVRITGQKGTGVVVTELNLPTLAKPVGKIIPVVAEALNSKDKEADAPAIKPADVVKEVEKVSRADQAKKLYDDWSNGVPGAEENLRAFKKAAKVGWDKLGIPTDKSGQPTLKNIKRMVSVPIDDSKTAVKGTDYAKKKLALDPELNQGSPRERIQRLLAIGLDSTGIAERIHDIKKASKKSWEALGVAQVTVDHILRKLDI